MIKSCPAFLVTHVEASNSACRGQAVVIGATRAIDLIDADAEWTLWTHSGNPRPVRCRLHCITTLGSGATEAGEPVILADGECMELNDDTKSVIEACENRTELELDISLQYEKTPFLLSSKDAQLCTLEVVVSLAVQQLSELPDFRAFIEWRANWERNSPFSILRDSSDAPSKSYSREADRLSPRPGMYLPVIVETTTDCSRGVLRLDSKVDSLIFKATLFLEHGITHLLPNTRLTRHMVWTTNGNEQQASAHIATILQATHEVS